MGPATALGESPLHESWDARTAHPRSGSPDTSSVSAPSFDRRSWRSKGPQRGSSVIRRERTAPGDLDNFLTPLAGAVGRVTNQADVVSSIAYWDRQAESRLRVAPARPAPSPGPGAGWSFASAETTVSADGTAWKQSVSDQVGRHPSADTDEPLELVVCLGVGPQRNWVSLRKPCIDAPGGILGLAGTRAWHHATTGPGASLYT